LRRFLGYGAATLVILAGLVVALLSQLLPLLARDPQAVANWLSTQVNRPIAIASLQARWERRGPLFDVEGLRIGGGDEPLLIDRAALRLDLFAGLLPGQSLAALQLDGLALTLRRESDGQWQLQGMTRSAEPFDLRQLEGFGELVIDQASLLVIDPASDLELSLPRIDARLRSKSDQLQLALAAYADRGGRPLRITGDLDTRELSGNLHVAAIGLDLATWLSALPLPSGRLASGEVSAQLWLQLQAGEVESAALSLKSASVALDAAAPEDRAGANEPAARLVSGVLRAPALEARLTRLTGGWSLAADFADGGWVRAKRVGDREQIEAGALELADWVAMLPPGLPAADYLADRLRTLAPRGRVELLAAERVEGALIALRARATDLAMAPVGERPGFERLSLDVDFHHGVAMLDVRSPALTLNWPVALREPLQAALQGEARLLALDGVWRLDSDLLSVRGADFAFDVAGELRFDGGRPSTDLRVDVFESPIVAAKRFWMRHRMPANAVRWLDEGLIDGRLNAGRLLLSGDLDDWPFRGQQGRLIAEAEVENVTLHYLPGWPIATGLSGTARFLNHAIDTDIRAEIMGNPVTRAVGKIASLRDPVLDLSITGGGTGPQLLALLRNSPLQQRYKESFDALAIGGVADIEMQLSIPFAKRLGNFAMQGQANLKEADLRDARWGLALDAAEGQVNFSERGLHADALQVLYSGQSARLALALGGHTSDPALALEGQLQGKLQASTLLDFEPGLTWLKAYMEGVSDWQIGVRVPTQGVPSLSIGSDLIGTRLRLPSPLTKGAEQRLPLSADLDLPPAVSGESPSLDLRLAGLLHLYGRLGDGASLTGVAAFGEANPVEPPASGLRVVGQVPVIDASAWAAMAVASASGEALIADVDLYAGELGLLERGFAETRVQLRRPAPGALDLRFDGPTIEGDIEVPAAAELAQRGVTARLDRLHWPAARGPSVITDLIDPASVPAFHLWVKELRLGSAQLGETRLETFPQADGMRVDLFESRSPALELFGRGNWTRVDGVSQSTFELEFTASELGGMLQTLGFSELIEGGETFATLSARWPGPPAAFAMENVEGGLTIKVGQGRVPQLKPGAGRLLGLFSLTEIPRRLALDFSDFFRSGLGFNSITGSFRFAAGSAVTEDLLIDSPAAEIRIRGRTGLKAQDYAQTMEVLPRTGSVLPVVGALAGGPAGAAIGAVAQAVLQSPFKQINRTLYRVDGSWAEPNVEVIERGPVKPESSDAGP